MVARATFDLKEALIKNFTVAGGQTATEGKVGTLANTLVQNAAAGVAGDVVFLESATAGNRVSCILLKGGAIVRVLVGTGGATAGSYAVVVSNGVTNTPAIAADGTVLHNIVGKFVESGVAGDYVGMVPATFVGNAAT